MVTYKKPKLVVKHENQRSEKFNFPEKLSLLWKSYLENTQPKLLLIDSYLFIVMLIGVINFIYCMVFMQSPFNIFISSFVSCLGSFTLGVALRMHLDPNSEKSFPDVSHRKALFDFVFAHIILHGRGFVFFICKDTQKIRFVTF
ncbi:hypothetical protein HZS_3467 [Henneguya salminicola]|nr:hypothetical protein HZS_3467 [Henneguya salminicola]